MSLGALILAGGAGTRLRPVVGDVPKPMAEVAGRPFLEYLLHQLRAAGITRAVLCIGQNGDVIRRQFGDGRDWGVNLGYSLEEDPLGTGGALRRAAALVDGQRFLAMNGDSFFDIPLAGLEAGHLDAAAALTIALARVPDGGRFGTVSMDSAGWITAFEEKSGRPAPGLINGGLYIIERTALDLIAGDRMVSLEHELLPLLVGRGLRGESFDGYFIDIGIPEDYARAQADGHVWDRIAAVPIEP